MRGAVVGTWPNMFIRLLRYVLKDIAIINSMPPVIHTKSWGLLPCWPLPVFVRQARGSALLLHAQIKKHLGVLFSEGFSYANIFQFQSSQLGQFLRLLAITF